MVERSLGTFGIGVGLARVCKSWVVIGWVYAGATRWSGEGFVRGMRWASRCSVSYLLEAKAPICLTGLNRK